MHSYITEISFSSNRQALLTNRGTIHIGGGPSVSETPTKKTSNNLILKDDWIERGDRRFLWLPHEYRSDVSAAHDNLLAIGRQSGLVSFLQFTQP